MRARINAVDRSAARFDPNEIIPEVIELLLHSLLASVSDRDDTNNGGDPDGDTEHREQAANLVA